MNSGEFEVVRYYEDVSGPKFGVAYIPVHRMSFSANLDTVRSLARYAGKIGIKTLILPPFLPYGLTINSNTDSRELSKYALNKANPYIKLLKNLARSHSLTIISLGVIEKSRTGIYASNIFVDGETAQCRFFSRKIVISPVEESLGIRPGNTVELVNDYYLNYGILIDNEILISELAKLLAYMGVEVIITHIYGDTFGYDLVNLLDMLRLLTGANIVHIGSLIIDKSTLVQRTPLIMILRDRRILEYRDSKSALIIMPLKMFKGRLNITLEPRQVRHVINVTIKYFRHLHYIYNRPESRS